MQYFVETAAQARTLCPTFGARSTALKAECGGSGARFNPRTTVRRRASQTPSFACYPPRMDVSVGAAIPRLLHNQAGGVEVRLGSGMPMCSSSDRSPASISPD